MMHSSSAAHEVAIAPGGKSQAQLIVEQLRRSQRQFTTGVIISWLVLLTVLVLTFSGLQFSAGPAGISLSLPASGQTIFSLPLALPFGPIVLRAIALDLGFMAEWVDYIAGGVGQTIKVSGLSIMLATLLALLAALGRLSRVSAIYALSTFYISLIRGTPLILQIFFFFLALPQLGVQLPGLWAGVLALGLNYGAYMSEIFRAGILSVGKGQREAALAVGMTYSQLMRRIVLPQALRFAIPPTGNEFIAMLKDSALVSVTGFVHETLWRAQRVGRGNFRNLEALLIAAVFYWIMTLLFTALQGRLEQRLGRGDR